ncbi:Aste57867_1462 [Aphanomyces stellatus]|uniref:Aste57867_1462 protein n=1 Tax=Aphanomyces stellatus TaxID=120398 RepID=A0A485KAP6_9STRA|nr:hypothetical protein As57867_001461 [Aphanomyces stellatus]VFT78679.1 Aste57867_1462 [Aphanomyces stellatus]
MSPREIGLKKETPTNASGISPSFLHGKICVDLIHIALLSTVQATSCRPFLANLDSSPTTLDMRLSIAALPSGPYSALARLQLPLQFDVQYDARRLYLHGYCLARAEIRSPKHGQVVFGRINVVPKLAVRPKNPPNLAPDTHLCLAIGTHPAICHRMPAVFSIDLIDSNSSYDLHLYVQASNGTRLPSVCPDLIQVHVMASPPPSWPSRLLPSGLVAVHPNAQLHLLPPDVGTAFAPHHSRSSPVFGTPAPSIVTVAILDGGTIDDVAWARFVSTEFHELLSLLGTNFGYRRLSVAALIASSSKPPPTFLVYFEAPTPAQWHALRPVLDPSTTQLLFCDDLHGCHMHRRDATTFIAPFLSSLHGFIGTYAYALSSYFKPSLLDNIQHNVLWLPHAASSVFLFDQLHPAPVPRVLLTGVTDPTIYPLRAWAQTMASSLPIDVHVHPGYEGSDTASEAAAQASSFSTLVHSYLVAFTDTLRLDYIVAKVFEIPATGALLLLNRDAATVVAKLGFVDGVHYMGYDPQNPKPAINYVLNPLHRRHVDRMRLAGHRLVRESHTTFHRARELYKWMEQRQSTWSMDGVDQDLAAARCAVAYAGESVDDCLTLRRVFLAQACCTP